MTAGDAIGLDIGGTTLKAVRVDAAGWIHAKDTLPAGGAVSQAGLLAAIDKAVASIGGLDGVVRIGVAVGGVVRVDGSMPADATNLPNLAEVPLPALFEERFDRPCTVANDAVAALAGEAWCGAAVDLSHALMITFGTGIGGALMLKGCVRRGPHGTAGEVGTVPVVGPDGVVGTLEEIAAPVRFQRRHGRPLAPALCDAARDPAAAATLRSIGQVLAGAHVLLDLEAIILGGGIVAEGEPLRAAIESAVRDACPSPFWHGLAVRLGALGPYAGAVGAVAPHHEATH